MHRYMNLSTMESILSEETIVKIIRETDELLLPMMKSGKEKWSEILDYFFVIKVNIRAVNDTLAMAHEVELKDDDATYPFIGN